MAARILLAVLLLTALSPEPLPGAGAAYVVRVTSAGLYERPNAAEPFTTLFRDQVVTVLQRRGEWLRIITEEGEEGWVREPTVAAIPAGEWEEESQISEASPDEIPVAVLYDFVIGGKTVNVRREPSTSAPLAGQAEPGTVYTIVATEGDWYQVSLDGRVEGWVHRNLGTRRESTNLPLKLQTLVEERLAYFDQFKSEKPYFRRHGWFPSFFLRSPREDITVRDLDPPGKEVTVQLSYARRDIEYRIVIDDADVFALPKANRTFLADLLLDVLGASPEISRVGVRLWFAVLERSGTMSWRSMGEIALGAAAAARISRGGDRASAVWAALDVNTVPPEVWSEGAGAP